VGALMLWDERVAANQSPSEPISPDAPCDSIITPT
jgi:hypothetical protein